MDERTAREHDVEISGLLQQGLSEALAQPAEHVRLQALQDRIVEQTQAELDKARQTEARILAQRRAAAADAASALAAYKALPIQAKVSG